MLLSDNELKVMEVIWDEDNLDENGEIIAKNASEILIDKYGWNKTANYVYFSRLLKKGAISRRYPNYTIKALIKKADIANMAVDSIVENTFSGSVVDFMETFLKNKQLNKKEVDAIKLVVESAIAE